MKFVIAHREVSGVYLCYQEGLNPYWGPRELAREYSAEAIAELTKVFPQWKYLLGVSHEEASIQVDQSPDTVPPKGGCRL
jgi:hypothetical protein